MQLKKKPKIPQDWREMHLCYLANFGYQAQDTKEYKELVRNPKYICKRCGRVAANKINLCIPEKL